MKRIGIFLAVLALCVDARPLKKSPIPVVVSVKPLTPFRTDDRRGAQIWHGLGDTYTNPGLTDLSDAIKERYPDTFVHLIHVEDDGGADQCARPLARLHSADDPLRRATFFGDANDQVQCVLALASWR